MAEQKKITTHEYALKAKYDGEKSELTVWVSDSITNKRWGLTLGKQSFQNQEVKTVFDDIKSALGTEPPSFKCTYPEYDGGNLGVNIGDGAYTFNLPEVQYDLE